jgi:hypothetical protein
MIIAKTQVKVHVSEAKFLLLDSLTNTLRTFFFFEAILLGHVISKTLIIIIWSLHVS